MAPEGTFTTGLQIIRSGEERLVYKAEAPTDSENQFYAFHLTTGEILAFDTERGADRFLESSQIERRTKSRT